MNPQTRKRLIVVLVVLVIICGFLLVNQITTGGKIYQGVKIGTVDVGGMSKEDAKVAVQSAYGYKIADGSIIIYAGEEGKSAALNENDGGTRDDDRSVDEVAKDTNYWSYQNTDLGLWLPADELVDTAYEYGRSNLLDRLGATFFGYTVTPCLGADSNAIDELADSITSTMGYELTNWSVDITDGQASVVEGHDGLMPNKSDLLQSISNAILESSDGNGNCIASVQQTPSYISQETAQSLADSINESIKNGVTFRYGDTQWHFDRAQIGKWIDVSIEKQNEGIDNYKIVATVNESAVRASLMSNVYNLTHTGSITVTMENTDSGVVVHPFGDGTMPDIASAATQLASQLFTGSHNDGLTISFGDMALPETMSFDDALNCGIIEQISTYTTEYSDTAYTTARNHNIHLAADQINQTIVSANGGVWSYNDIAGDSTEDEGFLAAGTIVDGEVQNSIGGGLCQVATTVFNCVYESGLPITERHNHSLYISSYPIGRDAAISYDTMDLCWKNSTESDCVLIMDYTDDSVTASIYGVSPHYKVTSETGDWEDGEKYSVIVKEDESLSKGYSYVDTAGTDGSEITVTRTVTDQEGNVVYTNTFHSVYDPKNEVIICGPDTEIKTDREKIVKEASETE